MEGFESWLSQYRAVPPFDGTTLEVTIYTKPDLHAAYLAGQRAQREADDKEFDDLMKNIMKNIAALRQQEADGAQ